MKRLLSTLMILLFVLATMSACTSRELAAGAVGVAVGAAVHEKVDDDDG